MSKVGDFLAICETVLHVVLSVHLLNFWIIHYFKPFLFDVARHRLVVSILERKL
jgi:hypothetical protein